MKIVDYKKICIWILALSLGSIFLTPSTYAQTTIPAFPGAEGFGSTTPGGRGGRVIEVTNLNNSGVGSLRACIEASGSRVCVFRTGGTIDVVSEIRINNPYITIAGQTAPGDGIALRKSSSSDGETPLVINTHDVIIRFIRSRPGPSPSASENVDALTIISGYNIVIDHCSFSWATDENVNTWYDPYDFTIQWSIISEGLRYSNHTKGEHSCGLLVGSDGCKNVSIHHNLMAHNTMRNPEIGTNNGIVDVVNNVVYNPLWSGSAMAVHDSWGHGPVNFVNNYLKAGPDTSSPAYVIDILGYNNNGYSLYASGNIGPTRPQDDQSEALAMSPASREYITSNRHSAPSVTTYSALKAYDEVLAGVGATHRLDNEGQLVFNRDPVDERIVNDVKNGVGRIINDPSEKGGWPVLEAGIPYSDLDHDGMPDSWETKYGFNPNNASDGPTDADGDGYTNTEEFLNGTNPVSSLPPTLTGDLNSDNVVDIIDLVIVGSNFGKDYNNAGTDKRADANADKVIDILDLVIVGSNFGKSR